MANDMREKHLVTDNPQNMTESMLNYAYAKSGKVYLLYANGKEDIDLCEYVSQLATKKECKLSADDVMNGSCIEGCDCEMAILYTLGVQAAELRERLKYYENLEDQGLLQTLPCKIGETLHLIQKDWEGDYFLTVCEVNSKITMFSILRAYEEKTVVYMSTDKNKAEQKLEEMRGEQNA